MSVATAAGEPTVSGVEGLAGGRLPCLGEFGLALGDSERRLHHEHGIGDRRGWPSVAGTGPGSADRLVENPGRARIRPAARATAGRPAQVQDGLVPQPGHVGIGGVDLPQIAAADLPGFPQRGTGSGRTTDAPPNWCSQNLPLGTTDATVIAICERLKLTEVASLDHRHFPVVRPRHVTALTLLPM